MTTSQHLCLITLLAVCHSADAGDWPMWRYDKGRTNESSESIPANLNLHWKRHLPAVKPAFRKGRLQFDQGYEPIVVGDTLYVALPHLDAVAAYATNTGEERWMFFTDGPVRLAPAAWKNQICFGSDDGHLYCVDSADGTLIWKRRAVPSARKIRGNGRLISVWPVRGGPVIADEVVYFAAGIWPLEGIFVYAIDVESGSVIWVNDRTGTLYGKTPHSGEAIAGLTPQGYLVVVDDELFVPCGTAWPATFNRHTGELIEFSLPDERNIPGGWFMAENTQEAKDVRRGKVQYDSNINQDRHEGQLFLSDGVAGLRSRATFNGTVLKYADGLNGVDGKIHSIVAANGRLFVAESDGTLSAFGAAAVKPKIHNNIAVGETPDDDADTRVSKLLQLTERRNGYILIPGIRDGSFAQQLITHTEFNVVAIAADDAIVADLRRQSVNAGILNERLAFLSGTLSDLQLPPYLADLVIVDDWSRLQLDAGFVTTMYERLRPYGGRACLQISSAFDEKIRSWLINAGHKEASATRKGDTLIIERTGALPGSVNYTKNWTAPDALVRAPLGLLWFDDTVAHFKRSPQPSVQDGVMISQHKDWKAKPIKTPPMLPFPQYGSGHFSLLKDCDYTDVYTGRSMSQEEAKQRLTAPAAIPDISHQPYHYRDLVETSPGSGSRTERYLARGKMVNPITGLKEPRRFVKSYGCDGGVDYGNLITMRSATPSFYDKRIESGTINISGPRSGCTNSIIPANGVLSVPYFFDGCSCSYPLPSGAALISMPQTFEQWTAWGSGNVGPIVRVGINLGAPGDRMTNGGTLFVDHPSVGGPSPEIQISTTPEEPNSFYRHALFTKGGTGWPWVCASGMQGLTSMTLDGIKPGAYTVRLYFIEPEFDRAEQRVFDVTIQGKTVLHQFDIIADSGGRMENVVKEFRQITLDETLSLTLNATIGQSLLSGVELVSADLPLDDLNNLPKR